MNALVTLDGGQAVTTSLVVAEGTDNDHASVIKLIRTHQASLAEFGLVRFEIRPRLPGQHGGGDVEYANLNEPQATLLLTMMRNSPIVLAFKVRLVKAFYAMAAQQHRDPVQVLNDPAAMRGLLLTYADKVLALEHAVAEQAPTVQAFERLARADGAVCITVAAKDLQVRPKDLFQWLQAHEWIYRRAGGTGWVAYQNRLQQGVLIHKVTTVARSDGTEKQAEQVLVTPKGLTVLAKQMQPQAA